MPGPYGPGQSGEGNEPVRYVVVTGPGPRRAGRARCVPCNFGLNDRSVKCFSTNVRNSSFRLDARAHGVFLTKMPTRTHDPCIHYTKFRLIEPTTKARMRLQVQVGTISPVTLRWSRLRSLGG